MGTVYDQLGWATLLEVRSKSANRIVRELVLAPQVRQFERCFEMTSSLRSRVCNGLDGTGMQIFANRVVTRMI